MENELKDLYVVNKPKGMSSFDVIRVLRKKLGVRKMGHAGTLDPSAEGVLIIGVGAGTKKLTDLVGLDKTYEVDIELGTRTATGDKEGEILEEADIKEGDISTEEIKRTLEDLEGEVDLPVSIYSAVKKDGVPLYKRARRGETVEAPIRKMRIYSLELIDVDYREKKAFLTVRMKVGSGVYVRSVVEEIGKRIDLPATVSRLVRTQVGEFNLEDALTLEEF